MLSSDDDADKILGIHLPGTQRKRADFGSMIYRGALISPKSTDTFGRWKEILVPILEWAFHAHCVLIEGYSFSSNMAYKDAIVEIGGIVRYHLRQMQHVPIEVAPSSLKKFLSGSGRAEKGDMLRAVRSLQLPIDDHNMADAFGLSWIGHAFEADDFQNARLAIHQREVIAQLKYPAPKIRRRKSPRLKFA